MKCPQVCQIANEHDGVPKGRSDAEKSDTSEVGIHDSCPAHYDDKHACSRTARY